LSASARAVFATRCISALDTQLHGTFKLLVIREPPQTIKAAGRVANYSQAYAKPVRFLGASVVKTPSPLLKHGQHIGRCQRFSERLRGSHVGLIKLEVVLWCFCRPVDVIFFS
jgi:hypothetical protein